MLQLVRAVCLLAVLGGVAGCVQGGPSYPPPLVALSNLQPEGQPGESGQETAGAEAQPANDAAVSLGLLIDVSGSMITKMDWVVEALQAFVHSLHPRDEVFLLTFSHHPTFFQPFTADRSILNEALNALRTRVRPVGGTALYDAVLKGLELVSAGKRPHKALLVLTDGTDTASFASQSFVLREATKAKVPIYSIGIGDSQASVRGRSSGYDLGVDVRTLQTLSERTKGAFFLLDLADPAGHARVLTQALDSISKELHQSPAGPGAA